MLTPVIHGAISFSGIAGALTGSMSAPAFANEMLAAKSVMDASTQDEIQTQLPVIDKFIHARKLKLPDLERGLDSKVDVHFFNNVFKLHFAHGLRKVFDARMSDRRFNARDHAELRLFVSRLPDIAMEGLLTYNVVNEYCDEQIAFVKEQVRKANGVDDNPDAFPTSNSRNAIGVMIALFGASFCLASLKYDHYVLAGFIMTCTILMMHFVGKKGSSHYYRLNMTKRNKLDLQETLIALGTAKAKLITHRKDIVSWSEMPLPPNH